MEVEIVPLRVGCPRLDHHVLKVEYMVPLLVHYTPSSRASFKTSTSAVVTLHNAFDRKAEGTGVMFHVTPHDPFHRHLVEHLMR